MILCLNDCLSTYCTLHIVISNFIGFYFAQNSKNMNIQLIYSAYVRMSGYIVAFRLAQYITFDIQSSFFLQYVSFQLCTFCVHHQINTGCKYGYSDYRGIWDTHNKMRRGFILFIFYICDLIYDKTTLKISQTSRFCIHTVAIYA